MYIYIYSYIVSDMRYVNTCKYLYIILYNAFGYSRSFPQVFGFPFFSGGSHRTWDGIGTRPGNPGGTLLEIFDTLEGWVYNHFFYYDRPHWKPTYP